MPILNAEQKKAWEKRKNELYHPEILEKLNKDYCVATWYQSISNELSKSLDFMDFERNSSLNEFAMRKFPYQRKF